MARSRNIKPSFFDHDGLADNSPIGRLLFIGMWTIADYKGELEWRPKRVKAQLLPYDDCDIEELAINLEKSGFIRFYSVQGVRYVHVVNFNKHQNPHKNERDKGSDIPSIEQSDTEEDSQVIENKEVEINRDNIEINRDKNGTAPADSLFPLPDPLFLIPDTPESDEPNSDDDVGDKKRSAKQTYDKQRIINTWNAKADEHGLPKISAISKTVEQGLLRLYKAHVAQCKQLGEKPNDIDTVINGYIQFGYEPTDWAKGANPTGKKYGITTALTQHKIDEILDAAL